MSEIHQDTFSQQSPEDEQKRLVQSRFGATAQAYVTSAVHAQGPDLAWIVEEAALTGNELVADVATGAGHTAFALAPHAREVIAIDITEPMLEAAQKLASERQITNVRFLKGDALALPLESNSIDLVACRHSAHHFSQISRAIQEWARVLKAGGKLIVVDSISSEEPEMDIFLNGIEILRDPSHVRNYRVSEWLLALNGAGLTTNAPRMYGVPLDVADWTRRMKTPPEDIERIIQRLSDASPSLQEYLHIEQREGQFWFTLPTALFVGIKTA